MIARRPRIDFGDALPHWAPNIEFVQSLNAGSTSLPHLEPYLNKVVDLAAAKLQDRPELLRDIAWFKAQEGNHYRQHRLFNKVLAARYPRLKVLEAKLSADFERFLKTRSLRYNLAYSEGFEATGIVYAEFFFEQIDDLLAGADPRLVQLWKWHLAEEVEHRCVCHDVYAALYGGYFYRLYGFFAAFFHIGGYVKAVTEYLLETDRADMSPADRKASRKALAAYRWRFMRFAFPRLARVLSPFYDPRKLKEPKDIAPFLAEFDRRAAT